MKAVSIVGADPGGLADRLVDALAERGRVARVTEAAAAPDGGAAVARTGAATRYELGETGTVVRGEPRNLEAALDELAPDHDYAVVTGFPEARLPSIAVGEEPADEVAARLDAADPDIESAVDIVEYAEPYETLASLIERAKAADPDQRAGAIATFTGRVRAHDAGDDPATTHLEFETYEGVAEERMAAIEAELEEREGVIEVVMHHKTGVVEAGEDIVFVVVLAGHRPAAFETVADGIERLKAEVPIFKKEVTVVDEFWAHERQ